MLTGCFTAIITPFTPKYSAVDFEGLEKLVEYQIIMSLCANSTWKPFFQA